MTVAHYKRAAVCAMTDFGTSDNTEPSAEQVSAVEQYLDATQSPGNRLKLRMTAVLRIAVKCVNSMSFTQHTKVLLWLRDFVLKTS